MRSVLFAAAFLAASTTLACAADIPKDIATELAKTDTTITGEKIVVPPNPTVIATTVTFAPGRVLKVHKHPYPHYCYVLDGDWTVVDADTGKNTVFHKGQFYAETNAHWHSGRNDTNVSTTLLVIDQIPAGTDGNTIYKDQ